MSGWTLACFFGGVLVGVVIVWWHYRGVRTTGRSLRLVARSWACDDWRARVVIDAASGPEFASAAETLNDAAERVLRRLKDLTRRAGDLQALVDALPDPILLADTRRKIILINQPAADLLDLEPGRALGETLEQAVSDPAVLAVFDRVAALDPASDEVELPLRKELRLRRRGRTLTFQSVATRTAAGGVLVVLRDISTLDQTLRMKTDFVANASHELRTPIAAIKVAFETLGEVLDEQLDKLDDSHRPAVQRCIHIVGGHLQRLEDMLRDLLDLSRVEAVDLKPEPEPIDTHNFAREVRQTLGQLAATRRTRLDLPDAAAGPSALFFADRRLLMLATKNLVENAIKYTPEGGTVSLRIDRRDLDGDAAAMHRHLTGKAYHEILVTVGDDGIGIASEHLERIFERFYQVDAARTGSNARTSVRGTGLGLSIVKHAVGGMGGSVRVESRPGRGSTFTIVLPQPAAAPLPSGA